MNTDAPETQHAGDETLAFKKLIYFQFFVLTGLVALALPGSLAIEGGAISDLSLRFYGAALCTHLLFLWLLWRMEPRFRSHYLAVLAVVLVVPWTAWAAKRFFDLDATIVGGAAFVIVVASTFVALSRGRSSDG